MAQTGEDYAASHISHALMEALVAAATWACSRDGNERQLPYKLQEIAEYSAFAHERGLFELFCGKATDRNGGLTDVGKARQKLGDRGAVRSSVWDTWHEHLNRAAAHLARRHQAIDPVVNGAYVNDQVVDLAREVVRLWMEYEQAPGLSDGVKAKLEAGRTEAFAESDEVTTWFGSPPLDWLAGDPAAGWPHGLKWWPDRACVPRGCRRARSRARSTPRRLNTGRPARPGR